MKSKYRRKVEARGPKSNRNAGHWGGKYAKPRHARPTKMERRLSLRRKDFEAMVADTKRPMDGRKQMRLASSGYHRPGSLQ